MLFDHPIGWAEDASITIAPAKFLIIDDHPLFRDALQIAIRHIHPRAQITEASSIEEAKAAIAVYDRFDLILLDLGLPQRPGFAGFLELQSLDQRLPIVVVSPLEDASLIEEAKAHGAAGFIAKTAFKAEVVRIVELALAGEIAFPPQPAPSPTEAPLGIAGVDMAKRFKLLTPMQRRVLDLLRQGKFNKQIAYELGAAESTVKAHVTAILHRLHLSSRLQAVIEATRMDSQSSAAGFGSSPEIHDFRPRTLALAKEVS